MMIKVFIIHGLAFACLVLTLIALIVWPFYVFDNTDFGVDSAGLKILIFYYVFMFGGSIGVTLERMEEK